MPPSDGASPATIASPAGVDAAGADVRGLAEEVSSLRDLFQRRLMDDKVRNRMYDDLRDQLSFCRDELVTSYLAPIAIESVMILDRIEASGELATSEFIGTVFDELEEVWRRRGLDRVPVEGDFDPEIHEAVAAIPTSESDRNGSIVSVRRHGYRLAGRLLRPAQVAVAQFRPSGVDADQPGEPAP